MPSSRGSSRPRGQMDISCVSRITGGFFATEPPEKPHFTTCCPAYYFEINPRYQFISSANISACIWIYTSFLTKSPNLNNFIILQAIKIPQYHKISNVHIFSCPINVINNIIISFSSSPSSSLFFSFFLLATKIYGVLPRLLILF